MKKCVAIGRVIPERTNVKFGPVSAHFAAPDVSGTANAFAEYSQISVSMEFDRDYNNLHNIISIANSIVSPIANYLAFKIAGAYQISLDMVVDVDGGVHHAISIAEPFFNEAEQSPYTFRRAQEHSDVSIPHVAIVDSAASRALEELSNALKRPHLTPMYCRLAIETIRSSFDATNEAAGWEKLRAMLNIQRSTIDTFWRLAADQRHGKTVELDWKKRSECLRIAWEIANRYLAHKADAHSSFEAL